jgi:hypothetical protein
MTDESVLRLPVKFKTPPSEERTLEVVHGGFDRCNHNFIIVGGEIKHVTYIIDEAAAEVECSNCKAKLNPMWVLARLAHHETRYRYQEEMKRLSERTRTKCDNCGHMTRISRR